MTTPTNPVVNGMGKAMRLVLTMGAARADGTMNQRAELKERVLPLMKEPDYLVRGQTGRIYATITSIMGKDWRPSGEWAEFIDGLKEPDEKKVEHLGSDYYCAQRDAQGNIRLNCGMGLLVANADHTRADVQGWFDRSKPGQYREQYRAALALLDEEEASR